MSLSIGNNLRFWFDPAMGKSTESCF